MTKLSDDSDCIKSTVTDLFSAFILLNWKRSFTTFIASS